MRTLVERIERAFPGAVAFVERDTLDVRSRLAIYAVADVLVVTSVRDGLNLLPLEYMLSREACAGALVLSEFSSLARILSSSITCNPSSIRKTSAALRRALELPAEARAARAAPDLVWCTKNTSSAWCRRVLRDVAAAAPSDEEALALDDGGGEAQRVHGVHRVHAVAAHHGVPRLSGRPSPSAARKAAGLT